MKKIYLASLLILTSSFDILAQEPIITSDSIEKLEEIFIKGVRVKEKDPFTFSSLSKKEIKKRNLGQDIPILLNHLPSVITSSDAGAGIGYTYMRVRGSDGSRINVTINGIPFNDAESQGTFWVNLPDFASSLESLQLQRGVGTSTNGSGAFGASLNLLTDSHSPAPYSEISSAIGSFNSSKLTGKFSTGLLNDKIEFNGRVSQIKSDGYIDRASSDLKSYFLQGSYLDKNRSVKAIVFGGKEKTYQAWAGITKQQLDQDRTQNPYTYDNEIDNYNQNHHQFHWNEKLNVNWSTAVGLNYTKGEGYFEQFKEQEDLADYNIDPINIGGTLITKSDIVRRKWLKNDFYVANLNLNYTKNKLDWVSGLSYNSYTGDHFGEIIWAQNAGNSNIRDQYYFSDSKKNDFSIFSKIKYAVTKKLIAYIDLQNRAVRYQTFGNNDDGINLDIKKEFNFFNPKTGLTYLLNKKSNIYFSYGRAHREPNRNDFENGITKAEKLDDFEMGWRVKESSFKINTNLFYMNYTDQLVLSGAIDNTGAPVRETSGNSCRMGIEVDAQIKLSKKIDFNPNITLSKNKNKNFVTSRNGNLVNLGNTALSFSPNIIAGSAIVFSPNNKIQFNLLSKYVGKQYMSNLENENSKLDAYFTSDLNVSYSLYPKKWVKSITFTGLVNNIFNSEYVDRGYYYTYDDTWSNPGMTTTLDGAGYYPQATLNYLVGISMRF